MRAEAERQFAADAGYRPAAVVGLMANAWTFRDAAGLAAAARWLLYADAAVCAAAAALSLGLGADELIYGDLARPLALVQLATALGSLIALLIWLYRANANARALGATDLMGSPGLAVAWFFIPIAFLFMPFMTVRDTWGERQPAGLAGAERTGLGRLVVGLLSGRDHHRHHLLPDRHRGAI